MKAIMEKAYWKLRDSAHARWSYPRPVDLALRAIRQDLMVFAARGENIDPGAFLEWLRDNWHVWFAFCTKATRIRRKGRDNFGARCIVEVLRYQTALRENPGEQFKLNDRWTPYLAALYNRVYGVEFFREKAK